MDPLIALLVRVNSFIYLGQVCQGTIAFESSVLPASPCMCPRPGKYESAWEPLVECSREGTLSAAVVFLPGGSEHFGTHDPIPVTEGLEGSCWCVPLYGERKPWGCRWWSRWIQNIEKAVEEDAKLRVYYFSHKKGKGKTCAEKRFIKGRKTSNAPPSLRKRNMKA